jgi:hypothetical protein
MAHPNEELTRRAYDAFSRGDVDTLRRLFADDAVFYEPGRNPVSGDTKASTRFSPSSGCSRSGRAGPTGSPCMMWWPTTSMPWGCT